MSINSLIGAIAQFEQAPCDKFACPKRKECSSKKLACTAFRYYVDTGKSEDPHFLIPQRVTLLQRPIETKFIRPNKTIFLSMNLEKSTKKGVNKKVLRVKQGEPT